MVGQNRSNEPSPENDTGQPLVYQIRIKGHLGPNWAEWFEGMTITQQENGDTLLTGPVVDQSALYGHLRRVRDLGLALLSVNSYAPGRADASDEI